MVIPGSHKNNSYIPVSSGNSSEGTCTMYVCVYMCRCTCMSVYVYMYVSVCVCMCVSMSTCVSVSIANDELRSLVIYTYKF